MSTMVTARRAVSGDSSRLNTEMRSCPRATCITMSTRSAAVVVLTPPPVEAEDAPTNISTPEMSLLASVREAWSREANPAVRQVTGWKNPLYTFCHAFRPPPSVAGLLHSSARMDSVPKASSPPVVTRTSRAWTDSLRQRKRVLRHSRITGNPRPPRMMRAPSVSTTTGSPVRCVRLR